MFLEIEPILTWLASLYRTIARYLSLIAALSAISLVLAFPAGANARTVLLRSTPTQGANLSNAPSQIRLWFSAPVDPTFSMAIVENSAHEYVNTHDAYLAPRDARETDVPLSPHLPPGVYTVVWRADSDSDGLVLSGVFTFAIVRPGELVPAPAKAPLAGTLVMMLMLAAAVCLWMLGILQPTGAAYTRQKRVHQGFERRAVLFNMKHILCFTYTARRASTVGAAVVIYLGLSLALVLGLLHGMSGICSPTRASPATSHQGTVLVPAAFHAEVRTVDKQFIIVIDINTEHSRTSTFIIGVRDTNSGKLKVDVRLGLFTTMLDMPMGTDAVSVRSDMKGHFRGQSDLSMGGLWQIGIRLQTPDQKPHQAFVRVLILY